MKKMKIKAIASLLLLTASSFSYAAPQSGNGWCDYTEEGSLIDLLCKVV